MLSVSKRIITYYLNFLYSWVHSAIHNGKHRSIQMKESSTHCCKANLKHVTAGSCLSKSSQTLLLAVFFFLLFFSVLNDSLSNIPNLSLINPTSPFKIHTKRNILQGMFSNHLWGKKKKSRRLLPWLKNFKLFLFCGSS